MPAAFNNLVGYKPTLGLHQHARHGAGLPHARCHLGVRADQRRCGGRRAGDARLRCRTIPGRARHSARRGAAGRSSRRRASACHCASQREFFGNTEYARLFAAGIAALRRAGRAASSRWTSPPLLEAARLLYEGPWVAERYLVVAELLRTIPTPCIRSRARSSRAERRACRHRCIRCPLPPAGTGRCGPRHVWSAVDALLLPTAGTHFTIEEERPNHCCTTASSAATPISSTCWISAAVAVPAGLTATGLPFGVTLVSPCMDGRGPAGLGRAAA